MKDSVNNVYYRATIVQFVFGMLFGAGLLSLVYALEQDENLLIPILMIVVGLLNGLTWFAYFRHALQVLGRSAA